MVALARESGKDWIAMHHLTVPADPRSTLPTDRDPYDAVEHWLLARMEAWDAQGLDLGRIVFDPGSVSGRTGSNRCGCCGVRASSAATDCACWWVTHASPS